LPTPALFILRHSGNAVHPSPVVAVLATIFEAFGSLANSCAAASVISQDHGSSIYGGARRSRRRRNEASKVADEARANTGALLPLAPYTPAMAEKMLQQILMMARVLFDRHPRATKLPAPDELPNTFLFRAALCVYLLLKRWISVGGAHQAKLERLRNDMVDVNFAVYATYFHGFLTADRKISEIYQETDWFLKRVFVVPPGALPMEPRSTQR
jgi:hypothetical protein